MLQSMGATYVAYVSPYICSSLGLAKVLAGWNTSRCGERSYKTDLDCAVLHIF